ncbi:hypothetical protein RO3G_10480 [Rhizopus delemar RA 99-880]|uniref:Survival Motor Neuron Gemin2-binding domain-containing protein n=1 Tax=Rhizopus delemar (strain RA 99-880 / ATCC MYA-4621 / FGSC 9543 / NRRL 43880) TaxID=246409 RepID=I1CBE0_RHIO9|nr:hypothetical protein RO3G_10480 [Rhizopus delemar RA 99-880]|eukprot:EIE85770.1 hypothetical protein RO3G_10480 [Rhizopus delemar RA 99-880]
MSKRRAIKGDHSKSAEDDVAVGTVIFSSGQTKYDEFWDDSELIEHWDKTVELYRQNRLLDPIFKYRRASYQNK